MLIELDQESASLLLSILIASDNDSDFGNALAYSLLTYLKASEKMAEVSKLAGNANNN